MNKKRFHSYGADQISYLFHLRHLQNIYKRKPKFPNLNLKQAKQNQKEEERELRIKINNNQKTISQIKMIIKNNETDPIKAQIMQIQRETLERLEQETKALKEKLKNIRQEYNSMFTVETRNNNKTTLPKIYSS